MGNTFIHESADIDKTAMIGDGSRIWQNCIVQKKVKIGNGCNIGANVYIEEGVKIGNGVKIKNNIAIYKGVIIEDDVFVGPNCVFTNVINPRSFIDRKDQIKETVVKKGATLGANSTIVCGHTIGRYAMVGAGTVVSKDIPDHALVVGNPANRIGYVCKCGNRLNEEMICKECGSRYIVENGQLVSREDTDE